jgi:hypothetical protein
MSQPFPALPFFSGNFAPVSFEADATDLTVRGELPKDLAGTLYRHARSERGEGAAGGVGFVRRLTCCCVDRKNRSGLLSTMFYSSPSTMRTSRTAPSSSAFNAAR